MKPIDITKAYYIKLGKGGQWERSSIADNVARIGWHHLTLRDINGKNWDAVRAKFESLPHIYKTRGSITADLNALRHFVESTTDDLWITFHASHLWWGRLGEPEIRKDGISKYRAMYGKWRNSDLAGRPLRVSEIPGTIAQLQGFRATICTVNEDEIDALRRLINDQPSKAHQAIVRAKKPLEDAVKSGIKRLHPKDFELLVDLVFRKAGWYRISQVGETMKYMDMELQEPITGERYQVQVKSKATLREFEEYSRDFSGGGCRGAYFVVHSPIGQLEAYRSTHAGVRLVLPEQLAAMVLEFGLTDWLLKKIR